MKKKEPTPDQALAKQIIEQYKPNTIADMQDALKEIFGPIFEAMLNGEMDNHLGYQSNSKAQKSTTNKRNVYGEKTVHTSFGEFKDRWMQYPSAVDVLLLAIASPLSHLRCYEFLVLSIKRENVLKKIKH